MMYIVNKDRSAIINAEQITTIYVGADNRTIKADYQNGNGCQLGRYNSETAARIAIGLVADAFGKAEICFMPDDSSINAKINLGGQKQHHIGGKKTKGYGGS